MDRILFALIMCLFIFSGCGFASLALIAMLLFNRTELNYRTLSALTFLLTCHFYGIIGLFYIFIISLSFLLSAAMYWYEMSFEDIRHKLTEYDQQTFIDGNEQNTNWGSLACDSSQRNNPCDFDKKLESFRHYRDE